MGLCSLRFRQCHVYSAEGVVRNTREKFNKAAYLSGNRRCIRDCTASTSSELHLLLRGVGKHRLRTSLGLLLGVALSPEEGFLDHLAHETVQDLAAELLAVLRRLSEALVERGRVLVADLEQAQLMSGQDTSKND